jgi:hypothetical protein
MLDTNLCTWVAANGMMGMELKLGSPTYGEPIWGSLSTLFEYKAKVPSEVSLLNKGGRSSAICCLSWLVAAIIIWGST